MLRYLKAAFEAPTGELLPEAVNRSETLQDSMFEIRNSLVVGLGFAVVEGESRMVPIAPQRDRPLLATKLGHSLTSTEVDILERQPTPENVMPQGHEAYIGAITTDNQTPVDDHVPGVQTQDGVAPNTGTVIQGPWPTPEQQFIQPDQKAA